MTLSGTNAGDFTISADTCAGATVASNNTCTVSVTVTPSVAGGLSAALNFADNASGSPQTVELSGSGPDFAFSIPSGSSNTATVGPGQTATYTLSIGSAGGLAGAMNFTCTGAPHDGACTVAPNPATIGNTPTSVTVTVTTEGASQVMPRRRPRPPAPPNWLWLRGIILLGLILTAWAGLQEVRKRLGALPWQSAIVPLAAGILLIFALAGCGGGSGGGGSGPPVITDPGTPVGNYPLTVTGTTGSGASAVSHSVTLTLSVKT